MNQVVQVNLVNVATLPAGIEARIYGFSAAEQALWKVRRYYAYSLQAGVWILALEQGFIRNAACGVASRSQDNAADDLSRDRPETRSQYAECRPTA